MNSPQAFDEEKYQASLGGLECSEVMYSYTLNHSDIFRLDSFYYSKEFLNDEHTLQIRKHCILGKLKNVSLLSFGAYSLNNFVEYINDGIPFVRCVDMKNGLIDTEGLLYISEKAHNLLYKSEVFPETILLSMSGSIGNVALSLPSWKYPINSNQDIAKIRLNGNLNPYYLYSFLKTKYGQNFMRREARGSVQQHIFLSQIEQLKIPIFSKLFYDTVEQINKNGFLLDEQSKFAYNSAETLLLTSLNLQNFTPTTKNTSVKTFAETFASGRLDAEYYQVKYDEIEERVKSKNHINAKECISQNNNNYTPLINKTYTYIELANIENNGSVDDNCIITTGGELPTRARRQVKVGDVIVSSVEGSIDKCAVISQNYDNALCSTGFYVMRSSKINSETLLLLFKSNPIQMLMKRGCNGTILTAISMDELKRIILPIPSADIQAKISAKVRDSFALREQSKMLLKAATRAVEIAIEKSEASALKYLEAQAKENV